MQTVMLAPPPRAIAPALAWYLCLSGCLALFGWLFASFGSLFCWIFLPGLDFRGWDRYPGPWEDAQGRVTAIVNTRMSVNEGPQIHQIEFSFEKDGRAYQGRCYTDGEPNLQVGQEQSVAMIPGQPASARLVGTRHGKTSEGFAILFVLLFPVIGLALVIGNAVAGRRMALLLAEGLLAEGRIVAQTVNTDSDSNQTYYTLSILYHDAAGTPRTTAVRVNTVPAAGKQLYLLYHPTRPNLARLFEFNGDKEPYYVSADGDIVARKKVFNPLIYLPPLVFIALQVLFCDIFVMH